MEWIIKLPTDGGCSSASSSVSEEEDGSVKITVITVIINSRTSVYLWLGGWLASIYRIVRYYLLLQLRHPGCVPFRGIKTCWVPLGSHTINCLIQMNRCIRKMDTGSRRQMMLATITRCRDSGDGDLWDLWAGCAYLCGILCRFASCPYSDLVFRFRLILWCLMYEELS